MKATLLNLSRQEPPQSGVEKYNYSLFWSTNEEVNTILIFQYTIVN